MNELNGILANKAPMLNVSKLNEEVAKHLSSENSGSESNTEDEQNSRPKIKKRKSASPRFNDFAEALQHFSLALIRLNR